MYREALIWASLQRRGYTPRVLGERDDITQAIYADGADLG